MASRILSIVIGAVLLTAAGLKLYGLRVGLFPGYGWWATPQFQLAAAMWEIVLGLWLLSGRNRVAAWLAAVITFLAFAAISGYLGSVGVASCGCFGAVQASPWVAFGVDLALLAVLLVGRPQFASHSEKSVRESAANGFKWIAGTTLVLIVAGVGLSWWAGSPEAALARLRGDVLTVSSDYVDFGSGSANQELVATVEIHNWSNQPVRLIGGTSDCSCLTTSDLPLSVPPGEARTTTIRFTVPNGAKSGVISRAVELWSDHPSQPRIRLRVGCRVVQ